MALLNNIAKGMITGNFVSGIIVGIGATIITPLVVAAAKPIAQGTIKGGSVLLKKSEEILTGVGSSVKESIQGSGSLLAKSGSALSGLGDAVKSVATGSGSLLKKSETAITGVSGAVTGAVKGLFEKKESESPSVVSSAATKVKAESSSAGVYREVRSRKRKPAGAATRNGKVIRRKKVAS